MFTTASIVSSIEFDKDRELFAIAGVTKRIKVYDYGVILKDMVDIHYPSKEMLCSSKISCISWNPYHKSTLASSDYDCSVIVWDVATGQVWPLKQLFSLSAFCNKQVNDPSLGWSYLLFL